MSDAKNNNNSALKVNKGIEQPSSINPDATERLKSARVQDLKAGDYLKGILASDRTLLSKAITLVESSLASHQELAQEIIRLCLPHSGNSVRIGITGVPGVGKSTFIESLGKYLTGNGHRIAVLAIDPSSQRSKGSILGDKTRMEDLANDPNAFIRPSSSAGTLGGVARKTRETIILSEAAGFDTIFVETVGVGQSETAVHSMVDFFLLLMLAGAGDELQGIKRGIMEMADAIVINKADGDNISKALLAQREYSNALHLFPASESGWAPKVLVCSSLTRDGIKEIWEMIPEYLSLSRNNGYFEQRRRQQSLQALFDTIDDKMKQTFYSDPVILPTIRTLEKEILEGKTSPYAAAQQLLSIYFNRK